jgi:hypothetical protein
MSELSHLMRDTILVYPTPSKDAYGRDSFSASVAHRGRFVFKSIIIIDSKGEEVQADGEVFLPNTVSGLDLGDKISYNSVNYRVIALEKPKNDMSTEAFIKITVKRAI